MIYFEKGSVNTSFSAEDLKQGLFEAFDKMGIRNKVLAIPPDYTRLPSRSGELTEFAWEYFGEKLTDVLPALGTHSPMTLEQINHMFGELPADPKIMPGEQLIGLASTPPEMILLLIMVAAEQRLNGITFVRAPLS